MSFCHQLFGHCPLEELSAPEGRLSCLSEKIPPHLALETSQQVRFETVAGLLDCREMSDHSLEEEWLGGKWFVLRDVIWGRKPLTGAHELNVYRFFLSRNGCLYGELGAALFQEGAQPVMDGRQNIVMLLCVPSLIFGEVRLANQ